jgi:hypothetical protein
MQIYSLRLKSHNYLIPTMQFPPPESFLPSPASPLYVDRRYSYGCDGGNAYGAFSYLNTFGASPQKCAPYVSGGDYAASAGRISDATHNFDPLSSSTMLTCRDVRRNIVGKARAASAAGSTNLESGSESLVESESADDVSGSGDPDCGIREENWSYLRQ